jgi:hypothetical protein
MPGEMEGTDMKGDFSRIRFNPARQYTSVLQQQGRVALDADANEQCFIDEYLRDLTNTDVIGRFGGPAGDAGFGLRLEGGQILIEKGRYYVDGILVQNLKLRSYDDQPYLTHNPNASRDLLLEVLRGRGQVTAQFVLEVWQRLVTDLDEPCLREPALGQADTTARLQTVWRVVGRLNESRIQQPVVGEETLADRELVDPAAIRTNRACANAMENPVAKLSSCCQSLYGLTGVKRTGAMGADTSASGDCGCQPTAPAGYQGLENQLYRVEIHHSGTEQTATFKWSRENASVVTRITGINGATVTVSSLGPDANLGFQANQWVELSDDTYLFGIEPNRPGELYQIYSVQPSAMQVTLTTPVTGIRDRNPRMRRWDQTSATAAANGIPLSTTPIALENGIEVTFAKGDYVSGDYWTIPARTADGKIDWPPCGSDGAFFQPAGFTPVFYAPLACVRARDAKYFQDEADAAQTSADTEEIAFDARLFAVDDCRLLFPPLTALCGASNPTALHVQSISWNNDDYMTLDSLIANGLTVTLGQTPASPIAISGASFAVTFEVAEAAKAADGVSKPGVGELSVNLLRGAVIVDSYKTVTATGATLAWGLPLDRKNIGQKLLLEALDVLLAQGAPVGWFTRVRVRLQGRAIFADGAAGQLYLDGQAFGRAATRTDGSACVGLQFPSGNSEKATDFESWFYLAPIVVLAKVEIQGIEDDVEKQVAAVKVLVDANNNIIGLQTGEKQSIPITHLRALVTFNYAPVAPVTVTFQWVGPGAENVISIDATVQAPAGSIMCPVPIQILTNPGPGTQNFLLIAGVTTALGSTAYPTPPTLAVTGSTPPTT